jgi:large subunit ribosomal protein L21
MYAVIDAGGKQARVQVGEQLDVELLAAGPGDEVSFVPKLVVDGDQVVAERDPLGASSVTGRVIGLAKGPKIVGFTYKAKARGRRRYGHRQQYTTVEITAIDFPGRRQTETAAPEAGAAPEASGGPDAADEPTNATED